jgi:hypothetical protein
MLQFPSRITPAPLPIPGSNRRIASFLFLSPAGFLRVLSGKYIARLPPPSDSSLLLVEGTSGLKLEEYGIVEDDL